jgi:hypothetical protein
MIALSTLRDATYITANLRPSDLEEVASQYAHFDPEALGWAMHVAEYSYVASYKGTPAVLFGASAYGSTTASVWAVGTHRTRRVIPEVTRFCLGPLRQQLRHDGFRWAEARSIATHVDAHRWLEGMGAVAVATLTGYGVQGEDFILFRGHI